jgi:hypothetical protein
MLLGNAQEHMAQIRSWNKVPESEIDNGISTGLGAGKGIGAIRVTGTSQECRLLLRQIYEF